MKVLVGFLVNKMEFDVVVFCKFVDNGVKGDFDLFFLFGEWFCLFIFVKGNCVEVSGILSKL